MERLLATIMDDYCAGDYSAMAARMPGGRSFLWVAEPMILIFLVMTAVGGIMVDSGAAFWAGWHGLAALAFLGLQWRRTRLVTGVD